jgi:7-cyano-7-deazaguanine synthase
MTAPADHALVLLSGGQDSTTCLAWALDRFERVETIGFDYGQRHHVELQCREPIRQQIGALRGTWAARLGDDHVLDASVIGRIADTALTTNAEIAFAASGLPTTFVPGRNLMFLTLAACVAYRRGFRHLVCGVCETDFSGYPDCRDDTIKAMQVALNLGMDTGFFLHTPLMWSDKAETWRLAERLGGAALVDLVVNTTHTCYRGDRENLHDWGYGCDACPACELRKRGWAKYRATP